MAASYPTRALKCIHFLWDTRLEKGGVVRAVFDLCAAVADRGHDVTLLTTDAVGVPDRWRKGEQRLPRLVEIDRSQLPGRRLTRRGLEQARACLRQADIAHLHAPWVTANQQLARRLRQADVPYVVTVHGMLDDWSMHQKSIKKRLFLALGARRFLQSAARVHFTADAEMAESLPRIPNVSSRAVVVPCFVDLSAFEEPVTWPRDSRDTSRALSDVPRILLLGRLHPVKGVDVLIEASGILRERGRRFQLWIAGPTEAGYRTTLERAVAERGLGDCVRFLGMVHGEQKVSVYQAAHVFALPTRHENFGLALIEALACGTPVVATEGVGIWRELKEAGALIVPRTAAAFAAAIARILDEPEQGRERGERGREFVTRWLGTTRVLEQYERLYWDAVGASAAQLPSGVGSLDRGQSER